MKLEDLTYEKPLPKATLQQRPLIKNLYQSAYELLDTKAHDYAQGTTGTQAHTNFMYSEFVQSYFDEPYKSYAVLIGTKLSRIAELTKGKAPMNESLEDSFKDLINYIGLMYERVKLENEDTTRL